MMVGDYAVDRFIERYHPHLDPVTARKALRKLLASGLDLMTEEPSNAQKIYRTKRGAVLVVVSDTGVVRTCLPADICTCGRPRAGSDDMKRWQAKPEHTEWSRALCWTLRDRRCNMKPVDGTPSTP